LLSRFGTGFACGGAALGGEARTVCDLWYSCLCLSSKRFSFLCIVGLGFEFFDVWFLFLGLLAWRSGGIPRFSDFLELFVIIFLGWVVKESSGRERLFLKV
jgi:hypothetical protein